ncbi:MAG: multidrug effflux MFS transporter [Pseudomonadota bacterium]
MSSNPDRPPATGLGFKLLLVTFVAMGPVSTDLYLPALPAIAAGLETSSERVQFTLGIFILGFAFAQLIYGPLADRFGRRPVIFAGLALYCAATVLCLVAWSIEVLLVGRLLQAVGGCAGPVIGRAIVRDRFAPREAAAVIGYLASAMALAPMLAPFLGGWLAVGFGWRATFAALLAYGLGVTLAIALALPETRPRGVRPPTRRELVTNYAGLLRDPLFVGFTFTTGAMFAALFTWITNSSFVLIDLYAVRPEAFGWYFAACAGSYVVGAFTGARTAKRFGIVLTLATGIVLANLAALLLAGLAIGDLLDARRLTGGFALLFFAAGFVIPQGTAGAIMPFPHIAGTASALMGFLQMLTGVLANLLSGVLFTGGPGPAVALAAVSTVGAALVFARLVGPRRALVPD